MSILTFSTLTGVVLLAVGVGLLKLAWLKRGRAPIGMRVAGWVAVIAGFAAFSYGWGAEVGIAFGALAASCIAYAIVVQGVDIRRRNTRPPRELALEPEERPTNWRRGIAKSLLAIVLSGIASIGVGVAIAVSLPLAVYDRIMLGGILVPVLWGGGMAWTLSDAKLGRATLLLLVVSAISYGIAFLPKYLT